MKILKFTTEGKCEEKEISGTLESLQAEVGGYIENVRLFADKDIAVLVDEEGRLKGKSENRSMTSLVGDIIIVGVKGKDFCDVPKRKVKCLKNIFCPEVMG